MSLKTFTIPLLSAVALFSMTSCRKDIDSGIAESGLLANKVYRCDTVLHDQPLRMFTQHGEVTDRQIIDDYIARYPVLAGTPESASQDHPYNIFSTPSQLLRYNGLVPFTASVMNGALLMKQQDTSITEYGLPQIPIDDTVYHLRQSYKAMRDAVLEMQGSYTSVQRGAPGSFRILESLDIRGSYANGTITLPYTFVASRFAFKSYPLALKAAPAPLVPAGDTLLVQEGRVEFR